MNYYEKELSIINFSGEYAATVQFRSDGQATKTLNVNAESAAAIIAKLAQVFMLPAARPEVAPVAKMARPYVSYSVGMNTNGNKILKATNAQGESFSIQTNGNLPREHKDGVTERTPDEVYVYVAKHGTPRQKRILGI